MPYKAFDKCVWKVKDGKKVGKEPVGCTKGDVKKYLAALYANDPKTAKNELAAIVEAFADEKRTTAIMAELDTYRNELSTKYSSIDEGSYESTLDEIQKMHEEMKGLYAELFRLKKK